MIGVSVGTLQNWEQGRRKPEEPARAPLQLRCAIQRPSSKRCQATTTYVQPTDAFLAASLS
jgi:hypothetical protein